MSSKIAYTVMFNAPTVGKLFEADSFWNASSTGT